MEQHEASHAYDVAKSNVDANIPKELFVFAIETAKGKIDNKLALEIYRLARR